MCEYLYHYCNFNFYIFFMFLADNSVLFLHQDYLTRFEHYVLESIASFYQMSFFSSAEFITILLIFNFMELLILSTFSELIWPTQHFNKKHLIGYKTYRLRNYTETVLKLRGYTNLYSIFNKVFYKYFL